MCKCTFAEIIDVLACSIAVYMYIYELFCILEPVGLVKIQTTSNKYTAILHTKTSNKRFIIQQQLL